MMRRTPQRIKKSFDTYDIKTGSAGFVQLFKNGKRIAPKNYKLRINVRRTPTQKEKGEL